MASPSSRRRPPLSYLVDASNLSSALNEKFFQYSQDAETTEFLENSVKNRSAWKDAAASFLKNTMNVNTTDANALTNRGKMHLFSTSFLKKHLYENSDSTTDNLVLDVGAGDGNITSTIEPFASTIYATEVSKHMRGRLKERGYVVSTEVPTDVAFDVVLLLNVLDRCDAPSELLQILMDRISPNDGTLVMSVVLPFCPFVENTHKKQLAPTRPLVFRGKALCRDGASFEESLVRLVEDVLVPMGFEVTKWTKLPYLCEGDAEAEYYVLDDAVLFLKKNAR